METQNLLHCGECWARIVSMDVSKSNKTVSNVLQNWHRHCWLTFDRWCTCWERQKWPCDLFQAFASMINRQRNLVHKQAAEFLHVIHLFLLRRSSSNEDRVSLGRTVTWMSLHVERHEMQEGSSNSCALDCLLELMAFPMDNIGHTQEATVESPKKGNPVMLQNRASSGWGWLSTGTVCLGKM